MFFRTSPELFLYTGPPTELTQFAVKKGVTGEFARGCGVQCGALEVRVRRYEAVQ